MKRLARVGLVFGVLSLGGVVACSEEPDVAKQHRVKGTNHLAKKEFKEATAEYALSLQADPKQEKVWEKKAFAHMELGETDKAAEAVLKILELKTVPAEKVETYVTLASMYMKGNDLDQAEKYFGEAFKLDPKNETALGWIAEIYAQRGGARSMAAPIVKDALEKALGYYDQVIALNPNSANTYLNKRVVMGRLMEYERQQKEMAESEAKENAKNAAVVAEATARAAEHQKKMDDFQAQFQVMTQKFSEAQKAQKAAQAANAQ
ncbi:tetratricopeptide repeat protein [Myxococcus sp. K15C18031901]|uniref:tetratricopeptide repeat protein n=1 Tax=Myxococcus dinghuensis TaxID=2906761 RepID=UPI0020A727C3|nr:tetratricopeptide repeat protein [Myxococcus dinghuensis]MCP3100861.1 tetratricopeptide repeat protein [Myxococcus dinghuensis]